MQPVRHPAANMQRFLERDEDVGMCAKLQPRIATVTLATIVATLAMYGVREHQPVQLTPLPAPGWWPWGGFGGTWTPQFCERDEEIGRLECVAGTVSHNLNYSHPEFCRDAFEWLRTNTQDNFDLGLAAAFNFAVLGTAVGAPISQEAWVERGVAGLCGLAGLSMLVAAAVDPLRTGYRASYYTEVHQGSYILYGGNKDCFQVEGNPHLDVGMQLMTAMLMGGTASSFISAYPKLTAMLRDWQAAPGERAQIAQQREQQRLQAQLDAYFMAWAGGRRLPQIDARVFEQFQEMVAAVRRGQGPAELEMQRIDRPGAVEFAREGAVPAAARPLPQVPRIQHVPVAVDLEAGAAAAGMLGQVGFEDESPFEI